SWGVVGVLLELRLVAAVALQAGLVAFHVRSQLVVRVLIAMHRMTREAGDPSARVATGSCQAVELATRHPHLAVAPEASFHNCPLRLITCRVEIGPVVTNQGRLGFDVDSRSEPDAFGVPFILVAVAADGMALAASFR